MKVILDTNVVLAAARSHTGASRAIVELIGSGRFELLMSVTLAIEYEQVLKRETDATGMTAEDVDDLVAFVCAHATQHELPPPRSWPLVPDAGDEFLARLAVTAGCNYLVSHNTRHLQTLTGMGISVVTPARFLSIMR